MREPEYTFLLYLPAHAPFDLWDREHRHGIKLYVQRVFIMDDAEQLAPAYLRFVRGVIDSNDLPLSVSREILQEGLEMAGTGSRNWTPSNRLGDRTRVTRPDLDCSVRAGIVSTEQTDRAAA